DRTPGRRPTACEQPSNASESAGPQYHEDRPNRQPPALSLLGGAVRRLETSWNLPVSGARRQEHSGQRLAAVWPSAHAYVSNPIISSCILHHGCPRSIDRTWKRNPPIL